MTMPYRSAAARSAPDTAVFCRACGKPTAIVLAESVTFRCACGVDQPTLPRESPIDGVIVLVSTREASYPQLSAFARTLGETHDVSFVATTCDGLRVEVSVRTNSGTVQGIDVSAKTEGLPAMRFVREGREHAASKAKGIVREVQTGDARFDEDVYIESDARDEDVLHVLASPAVRDAIRALLDETGEVKVDRDAVTVTLGHELPAASAENVRRTVGLVRVVAGAPRPFAIVTPKASPLRKLAYRIGFFSGPACCAFAVAMLIRHEPTSWRPFLLGVPAGLVFAVLLFPFVTLVLRGRSTSHREILVGRILLAIAGPNLGVGVVLAINGIADRSPEQTITMPIAHWHRDDDDKRKYVIETVGPDGASHSYQFELDKEPDPSRSHIEAYWHAGALGYPWEGKSAVLVTKTP